MGDIEDIKKTVNKIHEDLKDHMGIEDGEPYKVKTEYHFRLANFGRALCVVGMTAGLLEPIKYYDFGLISVVGLFIMNIYTSKVSWYR